VKSKHEHAQEHDAGSKNGSSILPRNADLDLYNTGVEWEADGDLRGRALVADGDLRGGKAEEYLRAVYGDLLGYLCCGGGGGQERRRGEVAAVVT
jgi:hypothetical protein